MFDGMEMGIFPLVARPALLDMSRSLDVVPEQFMAHWMGIITALFLLGAALGGFVFGWLGDRIGRVKAMSASILTYSLFSGLAFFSQVPWHLGAFRFLAALGMGGEWSLGVALVMEIWPEQKRPMLAGVIGAASNVGFALVAAIGMIFPISISSWRWVMLVGALPALLTFVIRIFVPESEKWKEANEKREGKSILSEIFRPPLLYPTLLAIAFASIALIGTWGSVQWLPSWADQMAGPLHPKAKAYTQELSAIGAIFGSLAGAWIGGRFGRRISFFALCFISLGLCAYLFRQVDSYAGTFLVMVFLVGGITASFYGWLPLYLPELFPTRVRATAQGLAYNSGRILAAVGAIKMGDLLGQFGGSYPKAGAIIT
ncbi:MAG: naiP, partial [Verrucomicrobiales bacterium]|nr:naiP [Verrucomicrobiales bacterium]